MKISAKIIFGIALLVIGFFSGVLIKSSLAEPGVKAKMQTNRQHWEYRSAIKEVDAFGLDVSFGFDDTWELISVTKVDDASQKFICCYKRPK